MAAVRGEKFRAASGAAAVGEISDGAARQSEGLDDISSVVREMNEATRQHAAAVEQGAQLSARLDAFSGRRPRLPGRSNGAGHYMPPIWPPVSQFRGASSSATVITDP